jgi:thiosulfate/3-mercaptopyruvate sulfurtransferase
MRRSRSDLTVIDLRSTDDYAESHIPGSFSVPFGPISTWSETSDDGLLLEMPPLTDILATLASIGASNRGIATKFVLVNGVAVSAFPQADSPRIAATLKYVGIPADRVAILDGGFPGWTSQKLPTTTAMPATVPTAVIGIAFTNVDEDRSFLVIRTYVIANLEKNDKGIFLIDGRDSNVYDDLVMEPWSVKAGHIPSAVSVPAQNVRKADGSYKTPLELLSQLHRAVGHNVSPSSQEQRIVYRGVGGYAASLYFVLTRILGFKNVVMYDGSAQEWSRYHDFEL